MFMEILTTLDGSEYAERALTYTVTSRRSRTRA